MLDYFDESSDDGGGDDTETEGCCLRIAKILIFLFRMYYQLVQLRLTGSLSFFSDSSFSFFKVIFRDLNNNLINNLILVHRNINHMICQISSQIEVIYKNFQNLRPRRQIRVMKESITMSACS